MWYIPVVLRIIVAFAIVPILVKKITGLHSRSKRFALQFFFCAIAATVIFFIDPSSTVSKTTLAIMAVGFANAIGNYCWWRATDISMSRNSLFTVWDDIIAMLLGYFLLKESQVVTTQLGFGILVCLFAVILFITRDFRLKKAREKETSESRKTIPPMFYVYVGAYSLIWGLAIFLIRYWAISVVSFGSFTFAWYMGAFLGAITLFLSIEFWKIRHPKEESVNGKPEKLTGRDVLFVMVLSAFMVTSMMLQFWALRLAPIVVVFPIFLVSELVIPTLIGLFSFKEKKGLTWVDWLYFGVGILGGFLVGFGR